MVPLFVLLLSFAVLRGAGYLACIIREGSVSVAFGGRRLPKTMLAA
jgi:hypothetical protein